jgi:hypothetical protein
MLKNEIAVRLYSNAKYGTTYAKGQYRHALFNASADLKDPCVKYLLDFYEYNRWEHMALTDQQIAILNEVVDVADKNTLASWVVRYNPATKEKTPVMGYAAYDMKNKKLTLAIDDPDSGVQHAWELDARPCKRVAGKNVADLLATNSDLGNW